MLLSPDPSACAARLLVTMPILFREQRLQVFFDQIRCFAEFLVDSVEVVIITNTADKADHRVLRNLTRILDSTGITFTIVSYWDPDEPKAMTWKHKDLILEKFLDPRENYTHFIYLEDDMRFTFLNFNYFVKYRRSLSRFDVIPSFLRYEYHLSKHDFFLTDFVKQTYPRMNDAIQVDGQYFVAPDYPYAAMYVLDRDLALEFIATASFDIEASKARSDWKTGERSAMGLCFEHLSAGRTTRFVVPVEVPAMLPYYHCLVHHLPNNYANRQFPPNYPAFGKTRVADGFAVPAVQPLG